MRWDRLFGELEGHAEHLDALERDALVADLREGEWVERGWIDGLTGDVDSVELSVRDIGVMSGRVEWATQHVIHLTTGSTHHLVATSAVQWARGVDRSPGLKRNSVSARLGWGPVLREAQDQRDQLIVTLVGGVTLEGRVSAVGADFIRVEPASGRGRDVPVSAINVVTFAE